MQPVVLVDVGGSYRAFTYDGIPSNQAYVDWIFYPDWASANFLPEAVSWIKTGGADNLFSLNPAGHGYTVPQGGFVLRCQRGALGGAGTSATIQGLSSGGLPVTIAVNMAQTFVAASGAPAEMSALTGGIYSLNGWCNYGSGITRTAELWRVLDNSGARELVYQAAGNTNGESQLFEANTRIIADVSATYFWTFNDAFSRVRETTRTHISVASNITASRMTTAGGDMLPGGNTNMTSTRFTMHEAKGYPARFLTTPPLPALGFAPGFDAGAWVLDAALQATKAQVLSSGDASFMSLVQPADAVAGAGGATFSFRGYHHLLELTVAVPTYPTMTEWSPPATPPAGWTITRASAGVWNITIPLAGGAKNFDVGILPAGANFIASDRPDAGNTTVVIHTFPGRLTWNLNPLKAGTSSIKLRALTYSDAPPVELTLNVTVT